MGTGGGRRRGIEGRPRPPTRHGWFQGGAVPVPAVCASCAAAGAMGTGGRDEEEEEEEEVLIIRGRIRVMLDLCRLPSTRIATFTYPTFSLPFLLQLQCV